ncbi:MAG: N-acetylmuramoyl-L-alanine amidase [Acidobacteria bacterium]|nr:N-acetylmuramoyl-L-alanine amidase [Acidobacteriota bacterium]
MRPARIVLPMAVLGAAVFILGGLSRAADGSFPIYFSNSKLVVKAENVNRVVYLPVTEIARFMGLPYTDATALETLTIRSGSSQLVVTKNSAVMSFNGQIVLLPNSLLRENERWLAPVEFLALGLTRLTNTEFRYRSGAPRIFAGDVEAPELVMNAQTLGPITRLTVRCAVSIRLDLRREDPNRLVLAIDRAPLDPFRERLDHEDRLVRSIAYDDSDGNAKIIIDTTAEVADIKVSRADNDRLFFVDLLRKSEPVSEAPPAVEPPTAAKPDSVQPPRRVRVIVIDPGHGGTDTGARGAAIAEKDLTIALARRLRTALQMRLGATVVLTRDADVALDNEARAAAANNHQANLFISLHAGYSSNKLDSGSSIFVMKENFGEDFTPAAASPRDPLFLPWHLGYRAHRQASGEAAKIFQEELSKAAPAWKFPVRTAPLAVLASAAMPALLLEIGNLNNEANIQTLTDNGFQTRLIGAIAGAIQRLAETPQGSAN